METNWKVGDVVIFGGSRHQVTRVRKDPRFAGGQVVEIDGGSGEFGGSCFESLQPSAVTATIMFDANVLAGQVLRIIDGDGDWEDRESKLRGLLRACQAQGTITRTQKIRQRLWNLVYKDNYKMDPDARVIIDECQMELDAIAPAKREAKS